MKIFALALALALPVTAQGAVTGALNSAVNAVLDAAGSANTQTTKVVPIVTAAGAQAGFAQIVGTQRAVEHTTAVVEVSAPSSVSIIALIPVSRIDAQAGTFNREYGVGIDALVNYNGKV